MKLRTKKSGFTLIEILIVTVIIGILATLGIVAYTNSLRNARNAKRVGDLNSIAAAWEQQYTTNAGTYPANCTTVPTTLQGGMPRDPDSGTLYSSLTSTAGSASCATDSFCFCVALENSTQGNSTTRLCTGIASSGSRGFYCVQNKQ
ncbi:MAG: ral secretion pathway protein [Patescibacteria group bacterium]|jgi:prepilin-type N-terminal cleavage/methylation domain-containing protein|nr:ral secretion pathway protein [Patescibacteria group bacterium]